MGDTGDYWRDVKPHMKQQSQQRRADHRDRAPILLSNAGIQYDIKGTGQHIVVYGSKCTVDFWPGTGLWRTRRFPKEGRGIFNLIRYVTGKNLQMTEDGAPITQAGETQ